ncbi:hypothetical protein MNBD_GAMMA05-573 [hydrothermal vent metagenome]|uniref:Uncharacterized protein n=1 Tax=hydrothermal vent metagenome TaxID=652676 RepID=A0A3B0WUF9_9ZZZZ
MHSYFQLDKNIIHLSHAAVTPWPIVTRNESLSLAKGLWFVCEPMSLRLFTKNVN